MPIATWTHGGSPLFTDITTNPPAGVVANGDVTAAAVTWDATNNENGDTGTVAITSEVSPGNIATVQVLVQLFDDGSFTAGDTLNTLQIVFDWQLTNGPMGTATAASAFNSTCDATDDPHGAGSSTGTYDRTDTGANLGVPTIGDLLTAVSIGGAAAVGFSCIFTYSGGTFSNHNRRLAVSNLQIVANYGSSTVTDIAPDTGPVLGGQVVTITGTGLTGVTEVNFITGITSTPATGIVVAADGLSLTCVTPPCLFVVNAFFFGPYDVEVVGVGTLSGAYTYIGVVKVTPAQGSITGGQAVTITGSGFNAATNVKFGGNAVSAFTIVSNTEIRTTTPFHRSGIVDVQVVGVATGANLYTYSSNRGFPTSLPADAFRLPPVPVASPVTQGLATGQPTGGSSGTLSQNGVGRPMELSNQKWLMEVKRTLESVPFMEWGAEQVIGVLDPDQIPQLPFSRLDFDHSPRLLGRTSDGAGAAEEIQVGPTLTLADGLLSIAGLPTGYTIGDLLYADTDHSLALLNDVSVGSYLRSGGVATAPLWSTLKLPNAATTGDVPYASASNIVSMLASVAAGSFLRSGGVATAPAWSTTVWTNSATTGDLLYASAANTYSNLADVATGSLLASGGVTTAPAWSATPFVTTIEARRTIATTSTDGLLSINPTASTALAPVQQSPRLRFSANVWRTVALTNTEFSWWFEAQATSQANPISTFVLQASQDGGATVTALSIGNNRQISVFSISASSFIEAGATAFYTFNGRSSWLSPANGQLNYTTSNQTIGIGLNFGTDGVLQIRNRAQTGNGTLTAGNIHIGATTAPTALLHLEAGTTAASTAPLKFTSGSLLTAAEAGAVEFLTDDFYGTITTGAARKKFVLDDGTALTSGRVPFATTNGRLTDDADLTFATDTLSATKVAMSSLTSGRVPFASTAGLLVDDSDMTFATDTLTVTKLSAPTSVSTGTLAQTGKTTTYNNIATAGWGEVAIYGSGRSTAQTAAVASVAAYTVGGSDGSFIVDANVNVTTSTTHNFTVAVDYTDETNTAQTLTLTFSSLAGAFLTAITNVTGAGPYEGVALHIRCKASTAITVKTVGTYTAVTYNVEANIRQIA